MVTTYGSDRHGLICGYLFAPRTAGQAITLDEAAAWLAVPPLPERPGFPWFTST